MVEGKTVETPPQRTKNQIFEATRCFAVVGWWENLEIVVKDSVLCLRFKEAGNGHILVLEAGRRRKKGGEKKKKKMGREKKGRLNKLEKYQVRSRKCMWHLCRLRLGRGILNVHVNANACTFLPCSFVLF